MPKFEEFGIVNFKKEIVLKKVETLNITTKMRNRKNIGTNLGSVY